MGLRLRLRMGSKAKAGNVKRVSAVVSVELNLRRTGPKDLVDLRLLSERITNYLGVRQPVALLPSEMHPSSWRRCWTICVGFVNAIASCVMSSLWDTLRSS